MCNIREIFREALDLDVVFQGTGIILEKAVFWDQILENILVVYVDLCLVIRWFQTTIDQVFKLYCVVVIVEFFGQNGFEKEWLSVFESLTHLDALILHKESGLS